ncbi:hypothetical protein CONPUDRAFT_142027 [Coniophora puteana RWD-64-598 SS2]|uniref:Uncharacterized protein n=1 Tax=Coniophora puteana (strain RWD-64-598) TaxID=741705 RepID=A0A5M3N3L4_CONPW|nr:uncharacterized protein CONPUDRAFT_142027 [Coniophora puteana RWD-64-598 SS2]EIW85481.1 hypothetical protein CONPUDRAFT_142027 [Coniophora puteana RWD-64-598 SS2]
MAGSSQWPIDLAEHVRSGDVGHKTGGVEMRLARESEMGVEMNKTGDSTKRRERCLQRATCYSIIDGYQEAVAFDRSKSDSWPIVEEGNDEDEGERTARDRALRKQPRYQRRVGRGIETFHYRATRLQAKTDWETIGSEELEPRRKRGPKRAACQRRQGGTSYTTSGEGSRSPRAWMGAIDGIIVVIIMGSVTLPSALARTAPREMVGRITYKGTSIERIVLLSSEDRANQRTVGGLVMTNYSVYIVNLVAEITANRTSAGCQGDWAVTDKIRFSSLQLQEPSQHTRTKNCHCSYSSSNLVPLTVPDSSVVNANRPRAARRIVPKPAARAHDHQVGPAARPIEQEVTRGGIVDEVSHREGRAKKLWGRINCQPDG